MINPAKDSRSWHGEKRKQDREHKNYRRGKSNTGAKTRGLSRRGPRVAQQDPRRFTTFDDNEEGENNEWYAAGGVSGKSLDELAEESLARSRSTRVTLEEEQEWAKFINVQDGNDNEEDDALFDLDALQNAIASNTFSERLFADDSEKSLIEDFEKEIKEEVKNVEKEEEKGEEEEKEEEEVCETTGPVINEVKEDEVKEENENEDENENGNEEINEEIEDDLIEDELDELLML